MVLGAGETGFIGLVSIVKYLVVRDTCFHYQLHFYLYYIAYQKLQLFAHQWECILSLLDLAGLSIKSIC